MSYTMVLNLISTVHVMGLLCTLLTRDSGSSFFLSVPEPLKLLRHVLLVERLPVRVVVLAGRRGGRLGVLNLVEILERALGALRL